MTDKKKRTKRGRVDHETLILRDLKEILKNIFDLKRFDKRTISRADITYDSFITVDRLRPNLRGYEFFDFLFDKKVLIVEVKTPKQYFDITVLAQIEDIQASYLGELKRKNRLKDEELDTMVIFTVVTSVSRGFIQRCRERGVFIRAVKDKKGLYVLHRLIPVYIIVVNELAYDEAYAQLLKYIDNLKRLVFVIGKMREGMRKEKFVKIVSSFVDYNPGILKEERIKDMIPVFTKEKDRSEYIDSFLEGFGKNEVMKHFKAEEVLKNYKPEEVLKNYKPEDRLKGLNKKDRERLKKLLMDD